MQRRNFLRRAGVGTAALGLGLTAAAAAEPATATTADRFTMNFAPHPGMFRHHAGEDIVDQIDFAADQGFTAWEDNGMPNRDPAEQERIGRALADNGMQMGVFVAHKIYWSEPNLASGKTDKREEFLQDIRSAVDVAKRCGATWMTVVPGFQDLRQDPYFQQVNVAEALKMACEILEPHELVMVLEPLNFRDHPGLMLSGSPQAYALCKLVGSPSCKILFDIYHQQITEGNLLPNIERTWDEIAYFQIGDNPGRKEPTTGEINYANIFEYIHSRDFSGVLGMEHGNSQEGKAGEQAVMAAYRQVDVAARR
jgi:hydroxypyruvate isomerase